MRSIFLVALVFSFLPGIANAQTACDSNILARGNNKFTFDIYKELLKDKKTVFFSPYSIYTALSMTAEGAGGETEKQMRRVLYSTGISNCLRRDINRAQDRFNKSSKDDSIYTANSIWLQKGMKIHDKFSGIVKNDYRAGVIETDFMRAFETSRKDINRWVEDRTRNRIKELLKEEMLDSNTRMVLVNAIWFKAGWKFPFDTNQTRKDKFYKPAGPVSVPFMNANNYVKYFENEMLQAVELPYKNDRLSMIFLLPARGEEKQFDNKLDQSSVDGWIAAMNMENVDVSIPKFKLEADFELKPVLENMGMVQAFSDGANFSGMSDSSLKIKDVIHKAFIEVKENGTEAAAATAVIMKITDNAKPDISVKSFKADRPFIFLIRDNETGTILFIGKMEAP